MKTIIGKKGMTIMIREKLMIRKVMGIIRKE